ncbi:MAG: hypothetical protein H7Y42_01250 [Chitinophagaceae bacterium]|nr:hypothetical protein [Chitinophagaceae bacterium]
MKKIISLLAISFLLTAAAHAQPSPNSDPEASISGQIVLPDNSTVTGSLKDNIRKKGELVIVSGGKKTKYKASDITSANIGNTPYITWNYAFYEVVHQGSKVTLLRKANEPSTVQYSGSEAVVVNSEGSIDDLFIRKTGETSLQLLSRKNLKDVLGSVCNNCITNDTQKIDLESMKKLIAECDACK